MSDVASKGASTTASATCLLLVGDRVVVRATAPPEAEYGMFEIGEIELSGAGGSSAMAHKQNPVLAEVLVTLARFNAVQVSGLHQALVHEQERSGAAWTLEWMILPQMLNATGTMRSIQVSMSAIARTPLALIGISAR